MLYKAVPNSVVSILKDLYLLPLPPETYLAGGIVLALYLSHRISIDIDLFTENEFYCSPIVPSLKEKYMVEITSATEKDTLIANVNNVRLGILKYPYPLLEPTIYNSDLNLNLALVIDIAAMKVVSSVQR
jgi:hypothetical protein